VALSVFSQIIKKYLRNNTRLSTPKKIYILGLYSYSEKNLVVTKNRQINDFFDEGFKKERFSTVLI
jgi:hypothetical protein